MSAIDPAAAPSIPGFDADLCAALADLLDLAPYLEGDTVSLGAELGELFFLAHGEAAASRVVSADGAFDLTPIAPGRLYGLAAAFAGPITTPITLMFRTPGLLGRMDAGAFAARALASPALSAAVIRLLAAAAQAAERSGGAEVGGARRLYRILADQMRKDGEDFVIDPLPRHAALALKAGIADHEAAALIGALIERGIAERAPRRLRICRPPEFLALI